MTRADVHEYLSDRDWISKQEITVLASEVVSRLKQERATRDAVLEISPAKERFLFDQLNRTIRESMFFDLRTRYTPERLAKLARLTDAFLEYVDEVDALNRIGFEVIKIDDAHRHDAARLVKALEENSKQKVKRGNRWEMAFLPEAMALYSVVFGVEPVSTSNEYVQTGPKPTIYYLQSIVRYVAIRQAASFGEHSDEGWPTTWRVPSDSHLGNKVAEILNCGLDPKASVDTWIKHKSHLSWLLQGPEYKK